MWVTKFNELQSQILPKVQVHSHFSKELQLGSEPMNGMPVTAMRVQSKACRSEDRNMLGTCSISPVKMNMFYFSSVKHVKGPSEVGRYEGKPWTNG